MEAANIERGSECRRSSHQAGVGGGARLRSPDAGNSTSLRSGTLMQVKAEDVGLGVWF
jgi:hypothetical protein